MPNLKLKRKKLTVNIFIKLYGKGIYSVLFIFLSCTDNNKRFNLNITLKECKKAL